MKITENEFIQKSIEKYNNTYDYSFVHYKDEHSKVSIYCNIHEGLFIQTPTQHLINSGCCKCYSQNNFFGFFIKPLLYILSLFSKFIEY
jgi:hypothetical protein